MAIDPRVIAPFVSGPILRRLKWSWVGYGLAAYAGLRLMKRFDIMPHYADKGIRLIERGAQLAHPRPT
jgi:hypothetical protein